MLNVPALPLRKHAPVDARRALGKADVRLQALRPHRGVRLTHRFPGWTVRHFRTLTLVHSHVLRFIRRFTPYCDKPPRPYIPWDAAV